MIIYKSLEIVRAQSEAKRNMEKIVAFIPLELMYRGEQLFFTFGEQRETKFIFSQGATC